MATTAASSVAAGRAAQDADRPAAAEGLSLRGSQLTFNGKPLVRNIQVNLVLPNNSLFRTHGEPTSRYLVETDPHFANYQ